MTRCGMVALAMASALIGAGGAVAAEWYANGDLHQKKMRDWKQASPQNRLATAADFVSKMDMPATYEELNTTTKAQAAALVRCISEGGADARSDNLAVAEIAAACMTLKTR